MVVDQLPLLMSAQDAKLPILVEGANAIMLDIDAGRDIVPPNEKVSTDADSTMRTGTYPYVRKSRKRHIFVLKWLWGLC